jgi:hypothetical protein
VFKLLGVGGLDDIGEDELVTLRGLANAIKEGEMTLESVFRADAPAVSAGATELNDALKPTKAAAARAEEKPA